MDERGFEQRNYIQESNTQNQEENNSTAIKRKKLPQRKIIPDLNLSNIKDNTEEINNKTEEEIKMCKFNFQ